MAQTAHHSNPSTPAGGALFCAALVLLVLAPVQAQAAQVLLRLRQPAVWEGQATVLELRISEPPPRISRPQLLAVQGLTIRGPVGPTQQQFSDGTGRTTTFISFSYEVSAVAGQRGTFRIGPATIPVPG